MANILLTAVGRRPYLVKWFQEALEANSVAGSVIAADSDPIAPARAFADDFVVSPSVGDPEYIPWLRALLNEGSVGLAISVNDFELSAWADFPESEDFGALVRVSAMTQRLVEDKFAMSAVLAEYGVRAPQTWLGSEAVDRRGQRFVTKGRFGSASRGLRFVDGGGLEMAVKAASHEVTNRQGVPAYEQSGVDPLSLVVVQEQIVGDEFGLDVVSDLTGNFAGVLARRKITMRAGETDRAVSVSAAAFEEVAQGIAAAVPHRGTFDVDVIVDEGGTPYVIDINPRFGGGYPFSHAAGARIPNAYVAWMQGQEPDRQWLSSRAGVVAGKYVEIATVPVSAGDVV